MICANLFSWGALSKFMVNSAQIKPKFTMWKVWVSNVYYSCCPVFLLVRHKNNLSYWPTSFPALVRLIWRYEILLLSQATPLRNPNNNFFYCRWKFLNFHVLIFNFLVQLFRRCVITLTPAALSLSLHTDNKTIQQHGTELFVL